MGLKVICYHYIHSEENPYLRRGINITQFEEQLNYLNDHFKIIHFCDMSELETDRDLCIITFDDGLKECYTKVFPLLKQKNIKAVFFISSSVYEEKMMLTVQKAHILAHNLGSEEYRKRFYDVLWGRHRKVERELLQGVSFEEIYPYDADIVREFKLDMNYRLPINVVNDVISFIFQKTFEVPEAKIANDIYLTSRELKEMFKSDLVELGAHTHSHYLMSRLSKEEQEREIKLSIDYLQNKLGCRMPVAFSYPFGRKGTYNQITKDVLLSDGRVKWACNMQRKDNLSLEDRFDIHRFDVNDIFGDKRQRA